MTSNDPKSDTYVGQVETFSEEVAKRGLGDVSACYWYHSVELGNGLVTPGMYDYRGAVRNFCFPADLSGQKVLDVGAATGFFSFEFRSGFSR